MSDPQHSETPPLWSAAVNDLPWLRYAACRDVDTSVFFPGVGQNAVHAKAICGQCPCRRACLDYALANGDKFGVFGGLSETERRRLRKVRAS